MNKKQKLSLGYKRIFLERKTSPSVLHLVYPQMAHTGDTEL